MNKIMKIEFKRIVNLSFIIAIGGIIFSICFDSFNDLLLCLKSGQGYVYYFFSNSAFGGMCRKYLLPVFVTLPFSASLCIERNNKVVSYIVSREGKKRYSIVKYVVNALSGGLVAACGTAILLAFLSVRFEFAGEDCYGAIATDYFHKWSALYYPQLYCLVQIILAFCRGIIWSSVAMFISVFTKDCLVVMLSPFLGSYVCVRVCQIMQINDNFRLDMILIGKVVVKSSGITVLVSIIGSFLIVGMLGGLFFKKMKEGLNSGTLY